MIYKLETFEDIQGYTITWKALSDIINKIYPDEDLNNKWYRKWTASNWIKNDMDRTYLSLKYYRNFKLREEKSLGYYDNLTERYIITDKHRKIIDIIKEYQKGDKKYD